MNTAAWTRWHSIVLMLLLLAIPVTVSSLTDPKSLLQAWIATLALLLAFSIICGWAITGRGAGVLIDDRNVMSLSRFQMVAWTLVILSAFLTAVLVNVFHGQADALKISLPGELWALMGISMASLIGSPLLLANKETLDPNQAEMHRTFELLKRQGDTTATLSTKGVVVSNTDPSMARFSDMFTGEEVGNAGHLDVARLQMFFFTVVSVLAYAVMLGKMFLDHGPGPFSSLPLLDQSMVTLIGISHGGYLVAKALPRSKAA